jgi:hypothetical protein
MSNCNKTTRSSITSLSLSSSPSTDTGSTGDSVPENSETPLRLPDISPTEEDLGGSTLDENSAATGSADNDNDHTNDDGNSDNLIQESDDEEESDPTDSENGGDKASDGPSLIPFP